MTNDLQTPFKLPKKFEQVLKQLSAYYAQQQLPLLQKLVVNASYYFDENKESTPHTDNTGYNSYIPGHEVHFTTPQTIYTEITNSLESIRDRLQQDLNRICQESICNDEYICNVYIEIQEDADTHDWRRDSGVYISHTSLSSVKDETESTQLWTPGYLKAFLSHKSENKQLASQLKDKLDYYGVTCFVAHEDIKPTKEWLLMIEKALSSADILIPLLTENFYQSDWTEQEVGIAIGRGIPVIPVKIAVDPHGFIGKYQAVSGKSKKEAQLAKEIFDLIYKTPSLNERVIDAIVTRLEHSTSFQQTNVLMPYLKDLPTLPVPLIDRLDKAYIQNSQIKGAFGAENELPSLLQKWRAV